MKVTVLQKEKDKIKLEVLEDEGFMQLISRNINDAGLDATAFKEHPFLEQPKLLVIGPKPLDAIEKAAEKIKISCDELEAEFKKE